MRLHHAFFLCLVCLSFSAHAFELIMIQAVSETKKTFITRHGKRQGIIEGVTATFTAENVSMLAKAISVTGGFTQWQLINPEAVLPFEKGAIVTYYTATEYLWAISPESERRKYIKNQITVPMRSFVFKGSLSRGISETVSEAPANKSSRGGILGEAFYERDIIYGLSWDLGVRYEREVASYPGGSILTTRSMLIADMYYYFDQLKDIIKGRLFIGAGLGYGLSNTATISLVQSGPVAMLPAVKIGVDLPFNHDWSFVGDGGFESLQTKEEQEDGRKQTTTQTNFKVGFGLRRYF
ncbi:MAG TPA: hypothetical protein VNJ08_06090 [Bacteriovoracaceae bacterium]|nr:hypothetical protein [Bacteriovoracaceae bacterium]